MKNFIAIDMKKAPSGSWIRDTVEKIPEKEMVSKLESVLSSTVDQLASFQSVHGACYGCG